MDRKRGLHKSLLGACLITIIAGVMFGCLLFLGGILELVKKN